MIWRKWTKLRYQKIEKALKKTSDRRYPGDDGSAAPLSCVIFSRDRPLQLHALVHSMLTYAPPPIPVHIIFKCSSDRFRLAYDVLQSELAEFKSIVFHEEDRRPFSRICDHVVRSFRSEKLLILVDDDIFIAPVSLRDFASDCDRMTIGSLRLGKNLRWCYPRNKRQPLPGFIEQKSEYISWYWRDGKYDWRYPLSLDGHIFNTADVQAILNHVRYDSPNTLESNIQPVVNLLSEYKGLAFRSSRLVNIPLNRVQTDFDNRCGGVHQDVLLRYWNEGYQMNQKKLRDIRIYSAHQEIAVEFVRRERITSAEINLYKS